MITTALFQTVLHGMVTIELICVALVFCAMIREP